MTEKDVGALGVYSANGHVLLGIVTERDITRSLAEQRDATTTWVSDIMSEPPVVVEGPVTAAQAAAMMRERHVRHLVLTQNGGDHIVSIRDFLGE